MGAGPHGPLLNTWYMCVSLYFFFEKCHVQKDLATLNKPIMCFEYKHSKLYPLVTVKFISLVFKISKWLVKMAYCWLHIYVSHLSNRTEYWQWLQGCQLQGFIFTVLKKVTWSFWNLKNVNDSFSIIFIILLRFLVYFRILIFSPFSIVFIFLLVFILDFFITSGGEDKNFQGGGSLGIALLIPRDEL